MLRTRVAVITALAIISIAAVFHLASAESDGSEEVRQVHVANFPDTQRIHGTVSVEGVILQTSLVSLKDIDVPPVRPDDTRRLVNGGSITTDGFSAIVLSLAGQSKGTVRQPGRVGAILIPEVEAVTRAFDEREQLQFSLEVEAISEAGAPYFYSDQPRFNIGFSSYQVLLYNTTDKTAKVDLYAYLTN